jgi:ATP-dependent RNA helicase DHX37/DHR1
MPKFVPRQRKHKALARSKGKGREPEPTVDSNAVEHIPAAKAELEEKKRRMKEELRKEGTKISGKKAKRLEKYIDNKLKKDENRELITQLAKGRTDTSLYQSSRKLGQGRETKRERLARALKDKRAGIDIDGDNDELLFEQRTVRMVDEVSSDEDENEVTGQRLLQTTTTTPVQPSKPIISAGGGLKRPLEVDEEGKPVLKKRKRRGGVNSKVSYKHVAPEEPEWEGFKSASEADSNTDEELGGIVDFDDISDASVDDDSGASESEEATEDSESKEESTSDDSEGDEDAPQKKERSSAFKSWANQQLNDALGYQTVSQVPNGTETPKIAGFKPRAPEQDPLPVELRPTPNITRKAFSIPVTRSEYMQGMRLQLPVRIFRILLLLGHP